MGKWDFPEVTQKMIDGVNEEVEKEHNSINEDADIDSYTDKMLNAVAKYFDVDRDDIEVSSWGGGHNIIVDGDEYWVGTYDEAYDEAVEEVRQILDDMGLEALSENFREYVVRNCVDTSEIENWQRDSNYYYIEDIEEESDSEFGNRLIQEMYDEGILTDEDFEEFDGEIDYTTLKEGVDLEAKKEEFLDNLCDREDPMDWLEGMYSESEIGKVLEDNGAIDFDAIAQECVDTDGIAHTLASYDGNEIELDDGFYAYKR